MGRIKEGGRDMVDWGREMGSRKERVIDDATRSSFAASNRA